MKRELFAFAVMTRFGKRTPSVEAAVENLAKPAGERVALSGAPATNMLGLSNHVPTRQAN
ncbi:MAG: hypothetical protein OXH79_00070 [Boseongicola sp.]|nr:hypothetical protein [Boseongicola sp.]